MPQPVKQNIPDHIAKQNHDKDGRQAEDVLPRQPATDHGDDWTLNDRERRQNGQPVLGQDCCDITRNHHSGTVI